MPRTMRVRKTCESMLERESLIRKTDGERVSGRPTTIACRQKPLAKASNNVQHETPGEMICESSSLVGGLV